MDRSALARELFDLFQRQRDQVQALMLNPAVDVRDAGRAIGGLVDKAEHVVEGYVASMDSGATRVSGQD
jgi:hypothetical protein